MGSFAARLSKALAEESLVDCDSSGHPENDEAQDEAHDPVKEVGQADSCPFCHKRYVNKTAIRKHLTQYISEWRLPADGKHDVLQIQSHLRPHRRRYQCWTCSKILDSRAHFREHVIYYRHCGLNDVKSTIQVKKPSRRDWNEWLLPFDEKLATVQEGTFHFFGLLTGTS